MERLNELNLSEKLIAGGGVLMLIAAFLPWWSYSEGPFSVSKSGFGAPGSIWSLLAILICIGLAGIVLATKFGNVTLPDLGTITWGQVFGGSAIALALFMLLKLWRIMDVEVGGMGFGFFVGLIAAAAVGYGAFLKFQESGGTFSRKV